MTWAGADGIFECIRGKESAVQTPNTERIQRQECDLQRGCMSGTIFLTERVCGSGRNDMDHRFSVAGDLQAHTRRKYTQVGMAEGPRATDF